MFEGKLCVITGAARGMGKSPALKYAENGANVVLMGLAKEAIKAVE